MIDPWLIIAGLAGVLLTLIGFWAKTVIERQGKGEERVERVSERANERDTTILVEIATLRAEVTRLKEEAAKCDAIAQRTAAIEAWQNFADDLMRRAVEGLDRANQFEARFEERLVTLFKGVAAITQRLERLTPALLNH